MLADFVHRVLLFVLIVAILTPIELTISHEKQSLRCRLNGLAYWLIWSVAAIVAATLIGLLIPDPLIKIQLNHPWGAAWEYVGAPVVAAILGDFYFYFHHRIQHAVPLLWRFHAVHHSIRNMNAVNNYHHVTDDFIKGFIGLIPLSLISMNPVNAVPVMVLIFALHPAYLHSPIKADLGWFRQVFGDNRFHRVHHSRDPRHYNKNFGAFTTLWDRLLGTAYWPAKDEWPEIGLNEIDEPKNVREWLTLPWRYLPDQSVAKAGAASQGSASAVPVDLKALGRTGEYGAH